MEQSERARIDGIRRKLEQFGVPPEKYLEGDYTGVAVHSSSIILQLNKTAADMFGYEVDEVVGLNAWVLFPPESAAELMRHLLTHSKDPYQVMARRKNGTLFHVELKGSEFEIDGDPVRVVLLKKLDTPGLP